MTRKGHTAAELIVALSVFALVAAASQGLLRRAMARYHQQEAIVQSEQSGRIGLSVLVLELQELDATDEEGGDLLEMSRSSVTYRSSSNMYFVCRAPEVAIGRLTVWSHLWVGSQAFDPDEDQLLVMASGDSARQRWLNYRVRGVESGRTCPGGGGSLSFSIDAATFAALGTVPVGAPVRGFRTTRVASYRGGDGASWIGLQTRRPAGEWAAIQPIAGPLAPDGLVFTYTGASGGLVTEPNAVERIGIRLVGASAPAGAAASMIETEIRLRNNPRSPR